jgi:hypothetical protein
VLHPPIPHFRGSSPLRQIDWLDAGIAAAEEAMPAIRALLAGEALIEVAQEYAPQSRLSTDPGLA